MVARRGDHQRRQLENVECHHLYRLLLCQKRFGNGTTAITFYCTLGFFNGF